MILPLPVTLPAREDSIRFISLKQYDDFFRDLGRGFPVESPPIISRALPEPLVEAEAPRLVVHDVGDFVASFVPTVADFGRLDPQFVIPKESWDKIPEYTDYGFAVFQLKTLAGRPHPMAFEFETRLSDQLFFPTVHIHDGEVHELESFDHMLYMQHPDMDRVVGNYRGPSQRDDVTGAVRSKWPAKQFCKTGRTEGIVQPDLLVHRTQLRGRLQNRDVIRPVSFASASRRSLPSNRFFPSWPTFTALLAGAGLLWLFRRRSLLRERKAGL